MVTSRRLVVRCHALLLLCLVLSLAAPLPSAAARPTATMVAAATTNPAAATTLGPAVTGVPGLPDGVRELVARRSRTSRTYTNSRGTFTTRSSQGSQTFLDAGGAWQPIDNTLVPDATAGAGFTNRANRYQVHLPPSTTSRKSVLG